MPLTELPTAPPVLPAVTHPNPMGTKPQPQPQPNPKQSLRSRRSSHERSPTELLQRIGLRGKEVVRILKDTWGWDVQEPHKLQTEKTYHTPQSRERNTQAQRGRDFFVGERELYAFILDQGGVKFLLPNEEMSESEQEQEQEQEQEHGPRTASLLKESMASPSSTQTTEIEVENSSDSMEENCSRVSNTQERRWKRRKKLSTARGKSMEQDQSTKRRYKDTNFKKPSPRSSDASVKDEPAHWNPSAGFDAKTQIEYQASLTARGWRAQLLRDVEVHLLRAVAAIARVQTRITPSDGRDEVFRPSEGAGPHAKDSTEILQELEALTFSLQASQTDLSAMTTGIIAQAERTHHPDRVDAAGRIGIPTFVSTGQESLTLMRDMERYLLYLVAAVRRYQRTKSSAIDSDSDASTQSSSQVKRPHLRALQLRIEESTAELQEITHLVVSQVKTQQGSPRGQGSPRSLGVDAVDAVPADVRTSGGQASQPTASPRRLDEDLWLV